MSRPFNVTQEEVEAAWKAVKLAGGGAGYDGKTIKDIEADLDGQMYKIWNRMSSGSLQAQPVLIVDIPKSKGGVRQLGIPTVTDRVAQTVIKNRLEPILEKIFVNDSYAYRAGKSAIDAVTTCRERCFEYEWAIDIDIKGFFDAIDHDIMKGMVQEITDDKLVILYVQKFLEAKARRKDDTKEIIRERGTPQGGVVSPLLANLYLHNAFDKWMEMRFPEIKYERYADDIIVHCVSEKQAYFIKDKIEARLKQYKLELHPEKTKIVYTGKSNKHDKRGHELKRKFTFLGYDFKPRMHVERIVFTPAMGAGARKMIRQRIGTKWNLGKRIGENIVDIAKDINPQIRGWINYYGHHRRSELYKLQYLIDNKLVGYLKKKMKNVVEWAQAWEELKLIKQKDAKLFCHWYMIGEKRGAV